MLQNGPQDFDFFDCNGSDYPFEVKTIEIWVPEFFKHNNSSAATVDLDVLLICLITNWENHENFKSDSLKKCYEIKTFFKNIDL